MANISRRQFLQTTSLFAMGVGSLALAACGNSSSAASSSSASSSSAAETAATEAAASGSSYTLVNAGKLTCISNLYFPPFEFMDEKTGEPRGYDIDMSKSLAEHLGLEINWLPSQAFDSLVPTIKAGGTADVAIAGMTITDKRKAEVDMSDPYIDSNQSLVTKVGSTETSATLNNAAKKIAVQAGTTGADWAAENMPSATIVPLDDIISAMNGVLTGSYDALVTDLPVSSYQIKNSFSDLQIVEEIPTGEQYGIAISKANPKLTEAINAALKQMASDGSIEKIQTEWFGSKL